MVAICLFVTKFHNFQSHSQKNYKHLLRQSIYSSLLCSLVDTIPNVS